ncbi:sigma-70 family RNA polymerase sigma factor [Actinotalea sp. Marseille-Q4924]|uniref:sigma-70 family RNA polymerase sigma factor n=1 Tax=Actinotalea sp. Marseille-Q4924 TaxID=2866571 RepID=UPI001CE3F31A|nr:sigma-70 family RNA polymerase sigma factor [Actinotalea sp. Marseille-Q4924]
MAPTAATQHPTNVLVTENLALVGYHVNAMLARVPSYVSRSDLVSAGHLALVRAARSFDESTGVPFARYAALRIRGALVDELRSMDWVSRGARQRARRITTLTDELTGTLGRTPSRNELAEAMGVAVEEVDVARGAAETRVLSIEGFDGSIADTVATTTMGPEESLLVNERLQFLGAGVAALPERLRYVVEQLFFHDRPVSDLADELGVTQSRISQLRTEALGLLKDGINASLDPELVPVADRPAGVAERRRRAYFAQVAARAVSSTTVTTVAHVPTQRSPQHDALVAPAARQHVAV